MRERLDLIDSKHVLSTRKQCEILSVHRSGLFYKPQGEKKENLEIMRIMDEHYLKHPTEGVMRIQDLLLSLGMVVNFNAGYNQYHQTEHFDTTILSC